MCEYFEIQRTIRQAQDKSSVMQKQLSIETMELDYTVDTLDKVLPFQDIKNVKIAEENEPDFGCFKIEEVEVETLRIKEWRGN